MVNSTIKKFGINNLLYSGSNFLLIARYPSPVRYGAVLVHKGTQKIFPDLSVIERNEYFEILTKFETVLRLEYNAILLNFYTLMLLDKDLHTHFLPRFRSTEWDTKPMGLLNLEDNIYLSKDDFNNAKADLLSHFIQRVG